MSFKQFVKNARRYAEELRETEVTPGEIAVPVYVINMERSVERRRFALNYLARKGFKPEVFPAVDGRKCDVPALEADGQYSEQLTLEKFSRPLSLAEIGCALSHLRLYQQIYDRGHDHALVLEDDAILVDDIATRLPALIAKLPADWDIVQLIYECREFQRVNDAVVRFTMQKSMPVAAAAYLMRRSGARKMLDNSYPIRYPADSLIGRAPRWGVNVYGADPQLASINTLFVSNISADRNLRARVFAAFRRVVVRLLSFGR